jgi:hypothetical protein
MRLSATAKTGVLFGVYIINKYSGNKHACRAILSDFSSGIHPQA